MGKTKKSNSKRNRTRYLVSVGEHSQTVTANSHEKAVIKAWRGNKRAWAVSFQREFIVTDGEVTLKFPTVLPNKTLLDVARDKKAENRRNRSTFKTHEYGYWDESEY